MKIDLSLKLSVAVFALVAMLCIGVLCVFAEKYHKNAEEFKDLNAKYASLQLKQHDLEHYGLATLEYYRIAMLLNKISGNKVSAETRLLLTERLWQISRMYDIDPLLILAIVLQESRGNPNTRGRYQSGAESGAYGLMQLKIETAQTLGKKFGIYINSAEDLMKPEINMVLGTAYLMRLIGHYEDVKHAVIAYNLGQGKVDRLLAEGQKLPTKYYEGVMAKYRGLERDLSELLLAEAVKAD